MNDALLARLDHGRGFGPGPGPVAGVSIAILVFYLARRSALRRNAVCEEVAEDAIEFLAAKDTPRALSVLSVAGGEFAEAAARAIGDSERGGSSTLTSVEFRLAPLLGPIWFFRIVLVASALLMVCAVKGGELRPLPRIDFKRMMWAGILLWVPGTVSLVLLYKLGSARWWCETRQNELLVEIREAAARQRLPKAFA